MKINQKYKENKYNQMKYNFNKVTCLYLIVMKLYKHKSFLNWIKEHKIILINYQKIKIQIQT